MSLTTNPNDPCLITGQKETGQNSCYLVLTEDEIAKGYTRPYRTSYIHKGREIKGNLRDLTDNEKVTFSPYGYVAFIENTDPTRPEVGTYLDERMLKTKQGDFYGGCGAVTTMTSKICETYARDPFFYGSTYCTGCGVHYYVGEFRWVEDNMIVGT